MSWINLNYDEFSTFYSNSVSVVVGLELWSYLCMHCRYAHIIGITRQNNENHDFLIKTHEKLLNEENFL